MRTHSVSLRPVVTEKSLKSAMAGSYTFLAGKFSRKEEIKKEIEVQFGVHVRSIRTIKKVGKNRSVGRRRTKVKEPDMKKAIVTVAKGEKIGIFEVEPTQAK